MKYLITGASGFIGSRVFDFLNNRGEDIVVAGRTKPIDFQGKFIEVDLLEASSDALRDVVKEAKATHLLHFAWYAKHGDFWNATENFAWIDRTSHLVRYFCDCGGSFVLAAGSCAEYCWQEKQILYEDSDCRPASTYGMSKFLTQQMLKYICDSEGVGWSWCRIFYPYGPGEGEKKFVSLLAEVVKGAREPFDLATPGLRDFIHVDDIARAIMAITDSNLIGVSNICSGRYYDLGDLLHRCSEVKPLSQRAPEISVKEQDENYTMIVGDNTRLRSIGWIAQMSLEEYLGLPRENSELIGSSKMEFSG